MPSVADVTHDMRIAAIDRLLAKGTARRSGMHRTGGDGRVERAIEGRFDWATRQAGRAWINGREVGGADPRYVHLSNSYD